MIKFLIYDGNKNPITIYTDIMEDDMKQFYDTFPEFLHLHDIKTGKNFIIPTNKYIICWQTINE